MTKATIFKEIRRLPEFKKDFKKLQKRFRTLLDDLEVFIDSALKLRHKLSQNYDGIIPINDIGIEYPSIYKAKKFACKSLKNKGAKSGIRIIYAYYEDQDTIEFIEVYYKGDKENEDRERIKKHYKNLKRR